MNVIRRYIHILLLFSLIICYNSLAASPTFNEYQVKAVFLYNFTQFVEWPTNAFDSEQSPIVIGILGKDPFGQQLDDLVKGEVVKNRKIEIKRYNDVKDVGGCHMLFISSSEKNHLDQILTPLKGKSILTIGDYDGFARQGGIIRLLPKNDKITLMVNVDSAKEANITISSKILRNAEIINK